MILAVIITEEQANSLIGVQYVDNIYYNPVQDINDKWFISEVEAIAMGGEYELTEFKPKPNDLT